MSDTNTAINTVSVDCPAKTNLTLHVGRPRSEWGGRHELDTIYCAVGVYDTVTTCYYLTLHLLSPGFASLFERNQP